MSTTITPLEFEEKSTWASDGDTPAQIVLGSGYEDDDISEDDDELEDEIFDDEEEDGELLDDEGDDEEFEYEVEND